LENEQASPLSTIAEIVWEAFLKEASPAKSQKAQLEHFTPQELPSQSKLSSMLVFSSTQLAPWVCGTKESNDFAIIWER